MRCWRLFRGARLDDLGFIGFHDQIEVGRFQQAAQNGCEGIETALIPLLAGRERFSRSCLEPPFSGCKGLLTR